MNRDDGWPGLRARYGLPQRGARHGPRPRLPRRSPSGGADVIDVYTTDAEIRAYALRVLTDDRQFFTRYDAVLLYRADLPARAPAVLAGVERLQGRIDNATMIALNARAKLDRVPESEVAAELPGRAPRRGGRGAARARARVDRGAAPPSTARWSGCRCSPRSRSPSRSGIVAARRPRARPRRRSAPPACCRPSRRWRCWCC